MLYSPDFLTLAREIDRLMEGFSHTQKDTGYGWRRTFDNGHRIDCIDYTKKNEVIIRAGRGMQLIKRYPILHGWFDTVLGVIAKLRLHSIAQIHDKNLLGVLKLIESMPSGMKVWE